MNKHLSPSSFQLKNGHAFVQMSKAIFFAAVCSLACIEFMWRGSTPGFDFRQRRNEVICVLSGIDPFLIWNGDIHSDKYYGYNKGKKENTTKEMEPVNGYAPWEYSYMLPFALLPFQMANTVWIFIELLSIIFLLVQGYRIGYREKGSCFDGLFVAGASLFLELLFLTPSSPVILDFPWPRCYC